MKKIFLVISIVILFAANLYSQEDISDTIPAVRARYGVYGHYIQNRHIASFRQLPGVSYYNPLFGDETGDSYGFGILYEIPFPGREKLYMQLRLGYALQKGDFTVSDITQVEFENTIYDAIVEYNLETQIGELLLEPLIRYDLYKGVSLLGGFNMGYVSSSDFNRYEQLNEAENITFRDGSKERFRQSGEIQELSKFRAGLIIGAAYDISFDKMNSFILSPEVSYNHSLTEQSELIDWKTHIFRAGISLKYSPVPVIQVEKFKQKEIIDTVKIETEEIAENRFLRGQIRTEIDTIETDEEKIITEYFMRTDTVYSKIEKPLIVYTTDVSAVDVNGNPVDRIKIEEFRSTQMHPLLNYIFFDENQTELPERYIRISEYETDDFDEQNLFGLSTMEVYYNLLNIIGSRMKKYPDAGLTLTAVNDGSGVKGGITGQRTNAVASYLIHIWNIDSDRIKIKNITSPGRLSNTKTKEGIEENRRVEIKSNNSKILEPVILKNSVKTVSRPETIIFNAKTSSNIGRYDINIFENDNEIYSFSSDSGENPEISTEVLGRHITKNNEKLYYQITGFTPDTTVSSYRRSIDVKRETVEMKDMGDRGERIDEFRLILFDYNSSSIDSKNRQIISYIRDHIKELVRNTKSEPEVIIYGHTDITGDEDYNMSLSRKRALSVKSALGFDDAEVKALGETHLLYDNSLPEGRFYCRTVVVEVRFEFRRQN